MHYEFPRGLLNLVPRPGLAGATGRPRFKRCKSDTLSADLVGRKFAREGPEQLWVPDITEHHTTWIPVVAAPAAGAGPSRHLLPGQDPEPAVARLEH